MRAFQIQKVPKPRDWELFHLPSLPLDIEIGCGAGYHPIRYALAHRERHLVAIEHTRARFALFAGRLRHHPVLANLTAIHADAIAWISHSLADEVAENYFILYPNPYPKARDRNKRWHAMPFMEKLLSTLKPGGLLSLATNEEFYADEAQRYFLETWKLESVQRQVTRAPDLPEGYPRTHFEKKYLKRGEICFNLVFKKPGRSRPPTATSGERPGDPGTEARRQVPSRGSD